MKRQLLGLMGGFLVFLLSASKAMAIVDPLSYPNNKIGVHILQPEEIERAAKLLNAEGKGSFGYVVVPIQATDRNRVKWRQFMRRARELRVIPIIRVATLVGNINWEEPNNYDLVDFANFLNDLDWPTKNRYVIIFNEVNRADEYGGFVQPEHYADVLNNAIDIFKQRNEDFFMLPAGLDNASANTAGAMRWNDYLNRMYQHNGAVFEKIDGWVSHSYPNFGFVGRVEDRHDHSIRSFVSDLSLISRFTRKKLPVFITETGWDMEQLGEARVAENFSRAFSEVFNDSRVVAVTPFLLQAGEGPFTKFSLIRKDGSATLPYEVLAGLSTKGEPLQVPVKEEVVIKGATESRGVADVFWEGLVHWEKPRLEFGDYWRRLWEWLTGKKDISRLTTLMVGERRYRIEVADSETERQRGLSGREKLESDEGMLFSFPQKGRYGFWMPKMNFDIDIVWITGGVVVGVSVGDKNKPTESVYPPVAVEYVLEVGRDSGIKEGDRVKF